MSYLGNQSHFCYFLSEAGIKCSIIINRNIVFVDSIIISFIALNVLKYKLG